MINFIKYVQFPGKYSLFSEPQIVNYGKDFASAKYNAETISGDNASALLDGNFTDYDFTNGKTLPQPFDIYTL